MPVLTTDPLAAKLNDLAIANSEGLLSDDEYRLLRQNLFERYSSGVEMLSMSPPPVSKHVPAPRRKHVELLDQPPPRPQITPARSKMSEVALFLRRATGRKSAPSPAPSVIKLSIPRLFSKKHEDALSSDTESAATRSSSSKSISRKGSTGELHSSPRANPQNPSALSPTRPKAEHPASPTRGQFNAAAPAGLASPSRSTFATSAPPSKFDVIPGGGDDIFEDDNLTTSDAIRKAIAMVEAECRRLVAAFNDLETSAVIRYRQEHEQLPRPNTASSSTSPRRPTASPLSPPGHTKTRSRSNSQRHANSDGQSVRSSSSLRTTKSIASLRPGMSPSPAPPPTSFSQSTPPPATGSSWGNRLSSLRRKGSASSLSSQGNSSFLSVGRAAGAGLTRSSSTASRSTGHLPLPLPVPKREGSTMMELLNGSSQLPPLGEGGEELTEVRRRRAEMIGRCEARLEYLRAKLKSAQLHEKLMRK